MKITKAIIVMLLCHLNRKTAFVLSRTVQKIADLSAGRSVQGVADLQRHDAAHNLRRQYLVKAPTSTNLLMHPKICVVIARCYPICDGDHLLSACHSTRTLRSYR